MFNVVKSDVKFAFKIIQLCVSVAILCIFYPFHNAITAEITCKGAYSAIPRLHALFVRPDII